MFGTRFELDEEKIKREGLYDLEDMKRAIDEVAVDSRLIKVSDGHYITEGKDTDMGYLGVFILRHMINYEWFTKNVKTWEWLDDDGVDDIIKISKENNKGVWE